MVSIVLRIWKHIWSESNFVSLTAEAMVTVPSVWFKWVAFTDEVRELGEVFLTLCLYEGVEESRPVLLLQVLRSGLDDVAQVCR